jgi:hypothetical protein
MRARHWRWKSAAIVILFCLSASGTLLWLYMCSSWKKVRVRQQQTWGRLSDLHRVIENYRASTGTYPPQKLWCRNIIDAMMDDTELSDLTDMQWVFESFFDGWERPFRYRYPGIRHPESFDIYSCGPDGIDDGGENDDIGN